MNLHGQMMNIQPPTRVGTPETNPAIAYKMGHRDARHAAAELALRADEEREVMLMALRAILPHICVSTAADGGPNKYSAAVLAADKVREALRMVAPRELVSG